MKKYLLILSGIFFLQSLSAQTITSLNPSSGNAGQNLNVTITGNNTHFTQGSGTFVDFEFTQGSGVTYNVSSWTSMTANITIPPNITSGYYDFYTSNAVDGFIFADKGFYVNGNPQQISISPNSANPGQTLTINITGTGTTFTAMSSGSGTVLIDFTPGPGYVAANSFVVSNNFLMAANFTVPPGTATAYYTLVVDDGGWRVAPNAFGVPATIGIGESEKNFHNITASPNPFTDKITFNAKISQSITAALEIYNISGEKVFEKNFNKLPAGEFEYTLRSSDFKNSPGIYFANWKTGNSSSTVKLFFVR